MTSFILKTAGIAFSIICIILTVFVTSFLLYDIIVFEPCLTPIRSMIDQADSSYKNPSKILRQASKIIAEKQNFKTWVVRILVINFEKNKVSILRRSVDNILWYFLLDIYFSEKEIFSLWCLFTPYEQGLGLNEAADYFYGRDVNELGIREILSILVRAQSPKLYKDKPEKVEEKVLQLIGK